MEIVRIIWIVNFFFFLLVLIFLWSKIYLVAKKIGQLTSIIKNCDEIADIPPQTSKPIPKS